MCNVSVLNASQHLAKQLGIVASILGLLGLIPRCQSRLKCKSHLFILQHKLSPSILGFEVLIHVT